MLKVKTVVRPSSIDGLGLFADQDIPAGTVIWEFVEKFDTTYTDEEFEALPESAKPHVRKYSYFCPEMRLWVLCGDDARFMNHAEVPNSLEGPGNKTTAARDIAAGEELTCDYTQFDARSFLDSEFHPNGIGPLGTDNGAHISYLDGTVETAVTNAGIASGPVHRAFQMRTQLHDGTSDHLQPTVPLDLATIHSVQDLVAAMGQTAFGGRTVGEAADVLHAMTSDPDCFVVATVAGAMTVAKMGLVLCDMIEQGMVHALVSTGALMAHGLVEASGRRHFKYNPTVDDLTLYEQGYNRVYDTLELEQNLDDVADIFEEVFADVPPDETLCSYKINHLLGAYLSRHVSERGILKSAFECGVPIYVPAFTDSEIGLDFALCNRKRQLADRPPLSYDPFIDLEHYTALIQVQQTLGIFTIGGGVPRNWSQQVGPYLELIAKRVGQATEIQRFTYGVRICPEPAQWGGLSGCTYSEGISWGKFVAPNEGGRFAEVLCDATIAWPLIVKAVQERLAMETRRAAHVA